ncbi:MAG: undecaprenyldiphospho-muramoylpentapeptide beta-N-acetylglucosaminyltransferase [Chlamydiales bacterium]
MSKKKQKKIILTAGGTGGHLFPAQAVASDLAKEAEVLFVSGGLETSTFFDRQQFAFEEISCATLSLKKPWRLVSEGAKIWRGVRQSYKILEEFAPDTVVGFGSFFSLPMLIAASRRKVPIILHEQNAIPGKVNRLFSSRAQLTAITFPQSAHYLKGKSIEVLFPTKECRIMEEAWKYFGLKEELLTLLVFGGSAGARRLNQLILEAIPLLQGKLPPFQLILLVGKHADINAISKRLKELNIPFCVKEFEPQMEYAWSLADIAITRAGASTINELIHYETPGILIPYPFASDNHQAKNAEHFVNTVKGGEMFLEASLTPLSLVRSIIWIVEHRHYIQKRIHAYREGRTENKLANMILH